MIFFGFRIHFIAEIVNEFAPKIKTRLPNDDIYFKDKQEELIIKCEAEGNPKPKYVLAPNKPKDSTQLRRSVQIPKFTIQFWKMFEIPLK